MSETSTRPEPQPQAWTGDGIPPQPSDILLHLIVAFLAPMFLGASCGDINMARLAAMETVAAYRFQNQVELLTVVQIIAFGLASLGSLSLSMADDLTLSMILRLRGNANALDRRAERNRLLLDKLQAETARQEQAEDAAREDAIQEAVMQAAQEAAMAEARRTAAQARTAAQPRADTPAPSEAAPVAPPVSVAPAPATTPAPTATQAPTAAPTATPARTTVPVAAPTQEVTKAMWAKAMLHNAAEIRSEMPHLPPLQRREASMRVEALSSVAHDLLLRTPVATAPFIQQPTPRLGQPPGRTTGTTR